MTKENHGPYEFLGSMVVNLMNIDKSISYSFLEDELHISGRDVSAMRQGKDLHVYQYVRVVSCNSVECTAEGVEECICSPL